MLSVARFVTTTPYNALTTWVRQPLTNARQPEAMIPTLILLGAFDGTSASYNSPVRQNEQRGRRGSPRPSETRQLGDVAHRPLSD